MNYPNATYASWSEHVKIEIQKYQKKLQYAFPEKSTDYVLIEGVIIIAQKLRGKAGAPDGMLILKKIKSHFEATGPSISIVIPDKIEKLCIEPTIAPVSRDNKKRPMEQEKFSHVEQISSLRGRDLKNLRNFVEVMQILDPSWFNKDGVRDKMKDMAKQFMFGEYPINKISKVDAPAGAPITVLEVMRSMGYRGTHEDSLKLSDEIAEAYRNRYPEPLRFKKVKVNGKEYKQYHFTERDRDFVKTCIHCCLNGGAGDSGGAGDGSPAGGAGGAGDDTESEDGYTTDDSCFDTGVDVCKPSLAACDAWNPSGAACDAGKPGLAACDAGKPSGAATTGGVETSTLTLDPVMRPSSLGKVKAIRGSGPSLSFDTKGGAGKKTGGAGGGKKTGGAGGGKKKTAAPDSSLSLEQMRARAHEEMCAQLYGGESGEA